MEWLELGVYLVVALVTLVVGKAVRDAFTRYDDDAELTTRDNTALGVSTAGYYLGLCIVVVGALASDLPPAPTYAQLGIEAAITLAYAVAGIAALSIGRFVLDRLVLPRFSMEKEVVEDRNIGAGACEFGVYVATACSVAGAIHGEGGGPETALAFFVLGQVSLVVFARLYELVTPYCLHDEIERDNVAAGLAFAGNLCALGVIILAASAGDFHDWGTNLTDYGIAVTGGLVLLVFVRVIADRLLLPKASLAKEIATDQNSGAAFIESAAALGLAAILATLLG